MPSRKDGAGGRTPVDAITHPDKRTNLPTADAHDFVDPEIEAPFGFSYPRPLYAPQLVWRGKPEQDLAGPLTGDAPPIYIQEKFDPRVLVEGLRAGPQPAPTQPVPTLFDTFDGLGELDLVDFYRHEANWSNRMILGDSLQVMASLAERERLRGKVQMIYLDPPYGIKFGSNWQVSARRRESRDGRPADATREAEQIKAFRDTWELGVNSYLSYLRDRLTVAKELLTESGSIFVQIGDENVHLVRSVLDEVLGSDNFVSLITFVTTSGFTQASALARNGDYLLWYARDLDRLKARPLWATAVDRQSYRWLLLPDGRCRGMTARELAGADPLPAGARIYAPGDLQSQGAASAPQPFEHDGTTYRPGPNSHWKANYPDGMRRLAAAGRLHVARGSLRYRRFLDDFPYQARTNLWTDTGTGNFTDDKVYVVQTNTKVVERCLLLSTDPGDLVLDPTCGSGTTAHVAEQWGRRWITVDTSRVALTLARQRLAGARLPWYLLADSADGRKKEAELSGQPRPSAEAAESHAAESHAAESAGGAVRHGFVCERAQRITLRSIANNPDVRPGMTPAEVDAAIRRHADVETLRDRPYEDPRKVRVAGPFTVESLSPHRSLAFADSRSDADSVDGFEHRVLANLRAGGIQNGRRDERLRFDTIEAYASPYIQAVGIREPEAADDGSPRRIGIAIGPQYGTVGPSYVKQAAREANRSDLDLLCVLAFAFDPATLGADDDYVTSEQGFFNVAAERRLGRAPVLLVRMNADLLMGELKQTGAGNLFTVFGEPDVEVTPDGDQLRVLLRGVDVYDPNTGELRSDDTDRIAMWMIDTAYNGESFFVRHCYFTGGQDPYRRLRAALKADVDPDAWASLYGPESRPFPRPATGRIAVKVVNDYGDEVMRVFTV